MPLAERIPRQKVTCQAEPGNQLLSCCVARLIVEQEARQTQQTRLPRAGGGGSHRPPTPWGDKRKLPRSASDRTPREVKPEAEFAQKRELPTHQCHEGRVAVDKPCQQKKQGRVCLTRCHAFRQGSRRRGTGRRHDGKQNRTVEHPRRGCLQQFAGKRPELLAGARCPSSLDDVADLPYGSMPSRRPTTDQPSVTSVLGGQQQDDGVTFSIRRCLQDNAGSLPLHVAGRQTPVAVGRPAAAATSAAKSPVSRSTPSPRWKRTKSVNVAPAFAITAFTRFSPSCTHTCSSSTTSS